EAEQQAVVVDLQRRQPGCALRAELVKPVEEVFARQVLTEQPQLQRIELPCVAQWRRLREDRFIYRRAVRVTGRVHVLRRDPQPVGTPFDVVQELLDGVDEGRTVRRQACALEQH